MSKFFVFALISMLFTSCFVSKKQYLVLEQELNEIKATLLDDDKDGVPNYLDMEANTPDSVRVDTKGRTILVEKIIDIDQDGILDADDFCPTIKGISSANGCPDKDGDGVYDFVDRCPNAAGLKQDQGCPVVIPQKEERALDAGGNLKQLLFIEKSLNFTIETKENLKTYMDSLAKYLNEHPTWTVDVRGYTDNLGDSLKNVKISEKRAAKVSALLIKKGVSKKRVTTQGFGPAKPVASNSTEKGRDRNNRVEFFIHFKE